MTARALLVVLALLAFCLPGLAREEIRAFASDITLRADGSVSVLETIDVNAEGVEIRRGIYRDIPLVMLDDEGNRVRPALDILAVTRNGAPEPYRTERMGDFLRIWIGDSDVLLGRAVHRYTVSYTMTRMGRFFADHDEVYWNATGNYWNFPILSAVAIVRLPEGAAISGLEGYTGRAGSTERAVTITRASDTQAIFRADRVLGPGEGLTVAVAFAKGVLVPPTGGDALGNWFLDRQDTFVPILAVIAVLGYFSIAWFRVGRDPKKGVIIPLFHPPEGFSPALVHYIHNWGWRGSGWTALTAAAFSLGVKGLIQIDNSARKLRLLATGKAPDAVLPAGEAVLDAYVSNAGEVVVDKAAGPTLIKTRDAFTRAIEGENRHVWFRDNTAYTVIGLVLALAALAGMVWLGYLEFYWVIIGAVIGIFGGLATALIPALFAGSRVQFVFLAVWLIIVGLNAGGGVLDLMTGFTFSSAVLAAVSIAAFCVVFGVLMRAPTIQGRAVMDKIDGLKLYLETAEKNRLNMDGEPPMTVTRFERLLPYAIALGVEKPWSEHFEAELARNTVEDAPGTGYSPAWYHGKPGAFSAGRIAGAVAGAATGMSAAMVAAQPVSSSSSGTGGGGFSGGGGGGGGGGGW